MDIAEDFGIDFCTLGMFIIDEIHFPAPKPPVYDILGGAGSYSALGARLFAPQPRSRAVGWIVDAGSGFPDQIREQIHSWHTSCLIRETPERQTTRGWNEYGEGEYRAFKYTTPKLRLDEKALTPALLQSKSFHLICSPVRCLQLVEGINRLRSQIPGGTDRPLPLYIWEPVPDLCLPENLADCYKALEVVDVVSPNHMELCSFFQPTPLGAGTAVQESVERYTRRWLDAGVGNDGQGAVVVRVGKDGCYVASRGNSRWIQAYHQQPDKVVDPTGGGNAFLGGLAMGLVNAGAGPGVENVEEAAKWGSIAASFAIEQVGMPQLRHTDAGETWNDEHVTDRVVTFEQRLH